MSYVFPVGTSLVDGGSVASFVSVSSSMSSFGDLPEDPAWVRPHLDQTLMVGVERRLPVLRVAPFGVVVGRLQDAVEVLGLERSAVGEQRHGTGAVERDHRIGGRELERRRRRSGRRSGSTGPNCWRPASLKSRASATRPGSTTRWAATITIAAGSPRRRRAIRRYRPKARPSSTRATVTKYSDPGRDLQPVPLDLAEVRAEDQRREHGQRRRAARRASDAGARRSRHRSTATTRIAIPDERDACRGSAGSSAWRELAETVAQVRPAVAVVRQQTRSARTVGSTTTDATNDAYGMTSASHDARTRSSIRARPATVDRRRVRSATAWSAATTTTNTIASRRTLNARRHQHAEHDQLVRDPRRSGRVSRWMRSHHQMTTAMATKNAYSLIS